jgi:hypothetical protein
MVVLHVVDGGLGEGSNVTAISRLDSPLADQRQLANDHALAYLE